MRLHLCFLFCCLAMLLTGCGEQRSDEGDFLARGEDAARLSIGGEHQKAAVAAIKLAADFPDSAEAQYLAGVYLMKLSQLSGMYPNDNERNPAVIKYLSSSLKIGLKDVRMEWMAAVSLAAISSPDEAINVFKKRKVDSTFLTSNENIKAFITISQILAISGKLEAALEIMDTALDANPGSDYLAQEKTKLLTEFSTIDSVVSFVKDFESQYGLHVGVKYQLCSAYEFHGKKGMAVECYGEILASTDLSEDERKTIIFDLGNLNK